MNFAFKINTLSNKYQLISGKIILTKFVKGFATVPNAPLARENLLLGTKQYHHLLMEDYIYHLLIILYLFYIFISD